MIRETSKFNNSLILPTFVDTKQIKMRNCMFLSLWKTIRWLGLLEKCQTFNKKPCRIENTFSKKEPKVSSRELKTSNGAMSMFCQFKILPVVQKVRWVELVPVGLETSSDLKNKMFLPVHRASCRFSWIQIRGNSSNEGFLKTFSACCYEVAM
jgi:hypothetical protein